MTTSDKPTIEDMQAFAHRYGLTKLSTKNLERMAELAVYVTELGRQLPRPPNKEDALPAAMVSGRAEARSPTK